MERQTAKELHLLNRKGVTIDELRELSVITSYSIHYTKLYEAVKYVLEQEDKQ